MNSVQEIEKFYQSLPIDIQNNVLSYFTIFDRHGLSKYFLKKMKTLLHYPRNSTGYANRPISYFSKKRCRLFKQYASDKYYFRHSRFQFSYLLNITYINNKMIVNLQLHPNFPKKRIKISSEQLVNVMVNLGNVMMLPGGIDVICHRSSSLGYTLNGKDETSLTEVMKLILTYVNKIECVCVRSS